MSAPARGRALDLALLTAGLLAATIVSVIAYRIGPAVETLLAPVATELAWPARTLLATYRAWPLLLVAVAAAWLVSADRRRGAVLACALGVGGAVALAAFGAWVLQRSDVASALATG